MSQLDSVQSTGASSSVGRRGQWPILGALSLCFSGAAAAPFVMPVIGGALIEGYGVSVNSIGYVFAVELASIALGSFVLFPGFRRSDPRLLLAATLAIVVVGNLLCLLPVTVTQLITLRAIIGLGEGAAQAAIVGMGARMAQPHRAFGVIYAVEAVVLTIAFLTIPPATSQWGPKATIMLLAVLAVIGVLAAAFARLEVRGEDGTLPEPAPWRLGFTLVLVCWLLFQVGQNAVWAYAEPFAQHAGLSFAQSNAIYALSSFSTIFAAALAGWAETRFRLSTLLPIAIALSALSILGFPLAGGVVSFGVPCVLFCSALFLAYPLISTLASRADPSGRLAAFLPAAQAAGMTAGPFMASFTLGLTGNFLFLAGLASAATFIGLLAVLPTFTLQRQAPQQTD